MMPMCLKSALAPLGLVFGLGACAPVQAQPVPAQSLVPMGIVEAAPAPGLERAPQAVACPRSVGPQVDCLSGRDANGAWYVIARPRQGNGSLIVHSHGGPRTSTPEADDPLADLDRFSVMVRQGYAWIGSTYRRGGYGVRMAAEDTNTVRQIYWDQFGRPVHTFLHGQSWGGNVAAKTAELYATGSDGQPLWDGVLLTNGVLMGGTRAYQVRADLRAVYQYYCRNHPSSEDGAYPVWQGLADNSRLTRAQLRQRIEDCTGLGLSQRRRTADQGRRLQNILAATGLQEAELDDHMIWASFLFRDLTDRIGGNPFDNSTRIYSGTSNDAALNAGVERFRADPQALARLAYDADLTGQISVPTVTLHAVHDPTVSYSAEAAYRQTVEAAGRSQWLVQAGTDESDHSKLEDAEYLTALAALEGWVADGQRPDPTTFQARCQALAAGPCKFVTADGH